MIRYVIYLSSIIFQFSFSSGNLLDWDRDTIQTKFHTYEVSIWSSDYQEIPWGMAFLPSGELLVTDISGLLYKVSIKGEKKQLISGVPKVFRKGQGGLLDVEIHPDFLENSLVYLSFSDPFPKRRGFTSVGRAKLVEDNLIDFEVIYKVNKIHATGEPYHFGSRMVFDEKNHLYFSIGDRAEKDEAQFLHTPNGKIHRIDDDGSIPIDNPFVDDTTDIASIWCFGNRNPQGLAIHPDTRLIWSTEHGPRGGDELNIIGKGTNYGWPIITYGINYNGTIISDLTEKDGMEQPVWHWTPSIAVCGIKFYSGNQFTHWNNNLLVTSLKYERLHRVVLDGSQRVDEEIIFEAGSRVRDVEVGPKGFIYVALENPGRIVILKPI